MTTDLNKLAEERARKFFTDNDGVFHEDTSINVNDLMESLPSLLISFAQQVQAEAAGEWISADEQPPTNDYYLVCWDYYGELEVGEAWFDDDRGFILPVYGTEKELDDPDNPKVVFWRPLPQPPVEE